MQHQPTLLEKECEALTAQNETLSETNVALSAQVETLSAQVDTLTTTTEALTEQRNANLALKEDNKSLSISLSEAKRTALERKRDADRNQADAEDGRLAIVYMRERYHSTYLSYFNTDDLPMTAKEKLELSEKVADMTCEACIDALKALRKEASKRGYRSGTRAAGMPSGYTGSAV